MYIVTPLHGWYSISLVVSRSWESREVEAVLADDNDDADLDLSDEDSRDSDVDVAISNKLADVDT
jgi:hypothetical protein